MRNIGRVFAALVVVLLGLCALSASPAWASAQSGAQSGTQSGSSATPGPITVDVVSQSVVSGPDQPFRLELRVSGARDVDRVRLAVHPPVTSRADYRRLVDTGTPPRSERLVDTETLKDVLDPVTQTVVLTVPPTSATRNAGVYPVSVVVGTGSAASKPLVTTLVRVPETLGRGGPLNVALVLPLSTPAALQPDSSVIVASSDRSRLDALATAFTEDFATVPLTLVPNPETLDALERGSPEDRGVLQHLKQMTWGREVLGTTFVPIDDEAWRSNGLGFALASQLNTGFETIDRTIRGERTLVTNDLAVGDLSDTPDTLSMRRDLGATRLLVDESQLERLDAANFPSTLVKSFVLADAEGGEVRAMVTDDRLARLAGELAGADAVRVPLLTQRFVADLAAAYFDNPLQVRGTAIVLPADWGVTAGTDALMRALTGTSVVRLVTTDQLFETVDRSSPFSADASATLVSGPLRRSLKPHPAQALGDYASRLGAATRRVDGFASVVGRQSPRVDALQDLLLVSADDRLTPAQRRAYLDAVDAAIDRQLHTEDGGAAVVAPAAQRVTMTSRDAEIPLRLENRLPYNLTVRLELRSDKLDFPQGYLKDVTLTPGFNVVSLPVHARTSGDSLLEIDVNAPALASGIPTFASSKFTVRSTALSGIGLALSVVALLVLLAWWFRHARRQRRAKAAARTAAEATAHPAASTGEPARAAEPVSTPDREPAPPGAERTPAQTEASGFEPTTLQRSPSSLET
jgi:hypothetical protein